MRRGLYRAIRTSSTSRRRDGVVLYNDQSTLNTTNIQINCPAGGSVTIDWGDGNTTSVVCDGTLNSYDHDYGSTGQYVVRVTGTLDQITGFRCNSQTWISGSLSVFAALVSLDYFRVNTTNVSGDLSFLSGISGLLDCRVNNTNVSDYTAGALPPWSNIVMYITTMGLSSTEIDNLLIDLNAAGGSNGTLYFIDGNDARTSASDDAYNGLLSRGWGGDIT